MDKYEGYGKKPAIADFSPHYSKKKWIIAVIVCVLIAAGGTTLYMKYAQNQKIDRAKIATLVKIGDCNKGLKTVSTEKADSKHVADSIDLLSYQATCLREVGRRQEAISTFKQLKAYYLKQNNFAKADTVDREIASINYYWQHSLPRATPQVTPAANEQFNESERKVWQ